MSDEDKLESRHSLLLSEVFSPHSPLAINTLIDALVTLYDECGRVNPDTHITSFLSKYKPIIQKINDLRITSDDFRVVKILGRGAFGEVNLVQCNLNKKYYAIKKLKKSEMISRQEAFFAEERDLMALAEGKWMTGLEYAFQDADYLYLVMEYLAGGNLLSLMYKYDTFDEDTARFYIAETILGVQEIHNFNYVYRDLKPENILLDKDGHVKLADFGSCYKLNEKGLVDSQVAVGTPDYIAPEVLKNNEGQGGSCGKESDWWSVGIVLYEMLCADPPFTGAKLAETYSKIMNHKKFFSFPDDVDLSDEIKDLISHLICDKEVRYTFEQIKAHSFFKSIDWDNIKSSVPPFVPELKHPGDTTYFEDEEIPDPPKSNAVKKAKGFSGEDLLFVGYTYMKDFGKMAQKALSGSQSEGNAGISRSSTMNGLDEIRKHKDDAEKWEKKYNQEKQKVILEKQESDKKLKEKEDEIKEKSSQLETERKMRKEEQSKVATYEKEKIDLTFEIDQLKQKNLKILGEKKMSEQRVIELQTELNSMIAKSTVSNSKDDDLIHEIEKLKADIKNKESIIQEGEKQISDLQEKLTNLEVKVKQLTSNLEQEKEERAKADQKLKDRNKVVEDLKKVESQLSDEISKLKNERRQLEVEITKTKDKLQESEASKAQALKEKKTAESEKSRLDIEISLSKKKIEMALEKEKELLERIKQLTEKKSTSSETSDSKTAIDQLTNELNDARTQKAKLEEKIEKLTQEIHDQEGQIIQLREKLLQEEKEHSSALNKIAKLEKQLEDKIDNEVVLTNNLSEAQKNIKDLTLKYSELKEAKELDNKKYASIKAKNSELEQTRDRLQVQLKRMTEKYDHEVETKQDLQLQLNKLKQKEGMHIRRPSMYDLEVVDDGQANEEIKKALEDETKKNQDLEESVINMRREKAKLEVEVSSLQKELLDEQSQKQIAVEQLESMKTNYETTRKLNEEMSVKIEEFKREIKYLDEDILDTENMNVQLEKKNKELEREIQTLKVELDSAKNRVEGQRSEVKEKKELRKLKEEYGILETQARNDELARKNLEEQLKDSKNEIQRLQNELEFYRKTVDMQVQAPIQKKERPASLAVKTETGNIPKISEDAFSSIRKRFNSIRRPKADFSASLTINGSPTSDTPIEGTLSVPKAKGIHHGWERKYIVIKDFVVMAFEKKEKQTDGVVIVDIRSPVFSCRKVPEGMIYTKPGELPLLFMIQFKSVAAKTSVATDFESNLSSSSLTSKIRVIEKDILVEKEVLKGFEKLSSSGTTKIKEAKKQIEGSKKKVDQLEKHLTKLRSQLASAEEKKKKRIDQVEEMIRSEENYQSKLINQLNILSDGEPEKITNLKRMDDSQKKVEQMRHELLILKADGETKSDSESQVHEYNGHRYIMTTFDVETPCQFCTKLLINRQGYYCGVCKYICHKDCHTLGGLSCSEKLSLSDAVPLYFKASEEVERNKWVDAINELREEFLAESNSSGSPSTPRGSSPAS